MLGEPTNPGSSEAVQRPVAPYERFQFMLEAKYEETGILIFPRQFEEDAEFADTTLVFLPENIARDVMPIVAESANGEDGVGVGSFLVPNVSEKRLLVVEEWRKKHGPKKPLTLTNELMLLTFSDSETEANYWDQARKTLADYYRALDEVDGDHDRAIMLIKFSE